MISVKINPRDKARMTFDHVADNAIQSAYESNYNFYHLVSDNEAFRDTLFTWLFERYMETHGSQ